MTFSSHLGLLLEFYVGLQSYMCVVYNNTYIYHFKVLIFFAPNLCVYTGWGKSRFTVVTVQSSLFLHYYLLLYYFPNEQL